MEKKISENLIWKIGSFLAAFMIWCVVMNIVKPLVEERVSVPIQIIAANDNTDENATYNIKDNITTVRVNYRIRSDYIGKINSNDFEAIINIPNGFTNGFLPIKVNYLNNVKNYIASSNFYPTTALITKDEIIKQNFDIVPHTTGQLNPGLRVGNIMLSKNSIEITANKKDIEKVKEVRVDIPLDNQSKNFSGQAVIKICDGYGNEITNSTIKAEIENVDYTVLLYSLKTVDVEVNLTGRPYRGFEVDNVIISPQRISIGGTKDAISHISKIVLPEIDITNIVDTITYEYNIKDILTDDSIDVGSVEKITVVVNIKPEGNEIQPEENKNIATNSSSRIIAPAINK